MKLSAMFKARQTSVFHRKMLEPLPSAVSHNSRCLNYQRIIVVAWDRDNAFFQRAWLDLTQCGKCLKLVDRRHFERKHSERLRNR